MKRLLLAWAAFSLMSARLPAQVPAGGEFHVNTYTTYQQQSPAAAVDRNGNFLLVWSSSHHFSSGGDVMAQQYEATGAPIGTEFVVNATTSGEQFVDSLSTPVAMRPDGRFVVVWTSDELGLDSEIRGQRFDATGARAGAEFQVDLGSPGASVYPGVAIAAHGTFVVVWAAGTSAVERDVYGQRFDATGNRLGAPFRVNLTTVGAQTVPRLAMDAAGGFVVVWQGDDGWDHGVFGQRFDPDGSRLGGEFQVNGYTTSNQDAFGVAQAPDGRFVVSWQSFDGSGLGIFGRRFDGGGIPLGGDFIVNQDTAFGQYYGTVATDANFDFVASWQGLDGGDTGIRGQRFDGQGARRGLEFQVNTYTSSFQLAANIAVTRSATSSSRGRARTRRDWRTRASTPNVMEA